MDQIVAWPVSRPADHAYRRQRPPSGGAQRPRFRGGDASVRRDSGNPTQTQGRPMSYRTVLLFGAPGAGKGTQGKILGTIPNLFHCACGDVFRSLKTDSAVGQVFLEYSSRGDLVPDETTIQLWREFINANTK